MNTPLLPSELVIKVIRYAAQESPSIARALLRVSRWTRDIALETLYSALVILPLSLEVQTPTLYHTEGRSGNVTTTPFAEVLYMLSNAAREGFWCPPITDPFAEPPEPSPQSLQLASLFPPAHLPRSIWASGGRTNPFIPSSGYFTIEGSFQLSMLLSSLIGGPESIQRLAIDTEAIATFWVNNLLQNAPDVWHFKLVDAPPGPLPPPLSREKGEALRLIRLSKVAEAGPGRGVAPSVTHFEAGAMLNFFHSPDARSDAALIHAVFPNLTHLAFLFYLNPSLQGTPSEADIEVLLLTLLERPSLQHLQLVVRDPEEVEKYYFSAPSAHTAALTKLELANTAKAMVEKINSPHLTYYVAPEGPEWALWKKCCEEGRSIWDMAS